MNNGPTIFWLFQSTLPGWGATSARSSFGSSQSVFQSTLPGWGATEFFDQSPVVVDISIHAPRMGSDSFTRFLLTDMMRFQSTLPGWGATLHCCTHACNCNQFQSTLPGWGATAGSMGRKGEQIFQSTLPGWGATIRVSKGFRFFAISIHAPRMGSDMGRDSQWNPLLEFQSTLPGWGATDFHVHAVQASAISIHAPRMGSDGRPQGHRQHGRGISIHAPRMGSDFPLG